MAVEELKSTWQNSNPEDFMKTALKQFLNFYLHKVGSLFLFIVIMIKHLFQKIFLTFAPNVLQSAKYTKRNTSLHLRMFLIKKHGITNFSKLVVDPHKYIKVL